MVSAPDPLVALTSARWAIEGSSDFWGLVLQISTVVVGIGVIVEVVATVIEILEDRRVGKPLPLHAILTFVGGAIVAGALMFEFVAEFKAASAETALRRNNAAAQGELDKRARDATAKAVEIAAKFGGLNALVNQKEHEMDAAVQRLTGRTDKAVNALSETEKTVTRIEGAAVDSAGKAATAADAASKTATSMGDTLNSERQMQAQMRAVITPRNLSDNQIDDLANKLRPFAKTPFDMFVNDDADSRRMVVAIAASLEKAGWVWKAAPSLGIETISETGKPAISVFTYSGISIEIAESSRPTLEKPVVELRNDLIADGIPVQGTSVPDDKMGKEFDRTIVHVFIGSRD